MDLLMSTKKKMDEMVIEKPHLKEINLQVAEDVVADNSNCDPDLISPKTPCYFRVAKLKAIKDDKINLEISSADVPTAACGDGCSVNLKGSRLLESTYGLKSSFSRCSSHSSYGTIHRLCTSEKSCQIDAKNLHENLRKMLKHFPMSTKSSELLSNALEAMEMNDIHLLNWGSTRMAGFLDACVQASKIVVPFLDTIITHQIQPDETKYIASPKGNYY